MQWYLIHTKPRQEVCALENLQRQGYECYLPQLVVEKLRNGVVTKCEEPLFPRYLFIRLGLGDTARSWVPIRSTRGVSRLVSFGDSPAQISGALVASIRSSEAERQALPVPLFSPGEKVSLCEGALAGLEGIYQMTDGEARVMVLIELLSRPTKLSVSPATLRKIG